MSFINNLNICIPIYLIAIGFGFAMGGYAYIISMITKYYFKKKGIFHLRYRVGFFGNLKFQLAIEWVLFIVSFLFIFWLYYIFVELAGNRFNLILGVYFFIIVLGIIFGAISKLDSLINITFRSVPFVSGIDFKWKENKRGRDKIIYKTFLLYSVLFSVFGFILLLLDLKL